MTAASVFWGGLLIMAATVLMFGTAAWVLYRVAPDMWVRLFPETPREDPAPNGEELRVLDVYDTELDLDREWEQRHRAQAARRRGQDLPAVESIGTRSLDEIRRDYQGGAA